MADKILMDTEGVANFRQQVSNISHTINDNTKDLNYLLFNFNQVSISMNILKQHMAQAISQGKKIIDYLNKMASDVERARQAFIKADNDTNGIESALFSPFASGMIGSVDKIIGTASEKGLLGKRTNTIATGFNRAMRRANGLPKAIEEVKPFVKLREGFGVLSLVSAIGTGYEDYKNNDSLGAKAGAMAVDGAAIGGTTALSGFAATAGSTAAVGLVTFAAGVAGVAAAPEIVVGVAAVTGAVLAVGATGYLLSKGAGFVKGWLHWN